MSLKRYKNPVNNHFIYNDDIRKSTCKECLFDMAGRHSENLMRHLKRKHPATYASVMREKQRRRSANPNQSGSEAGPLSSMFKFESEPRKLVIKSEKLVFRLDEPDQHQMPMPEACLDEFEEDTTSPHGNSQFESVDIGKEELQEVMDDSPDQLLDTSESFLYPESHIEEDPFKMTNFAQQTNPNPNANPNGSSTAAGPTLNTLISPLQVANDDASFLQHLGNKFGKYTSNTKYTVQYHINCILYKADMGCYDNADASKLPDSYI